MDSKGKVYLGSTGDFGYISYTETGELRYSSLKNKVLEEHRSFDNVWKTYILEDGVLFFTFTGIYIYNEDSDTISFVPPTKNRFHFCYQIGSDIYVREWGVGIHKLKGNQLSFIKDSEIYAQDRVYGIMPFMNDKILVVSRLKGLMLFDGKSFAPLNSPINDKIIEGNIYSSLDIENRYWVLGGSTGIYVINEKGEQVQYISNEKHLESNGMVYTVALDRAKNLWVGTYGNICRVDLFNPFTKLDTKERVTAAFQEKNKITLGSKSKVFNLNTQPNNVSINSLDIVPSIPNRKVWNIEDFNSKTIIGVAGGIYELEKDGSSRVIRENLSNVMSIVMPENNPNGLFVATMNGLLKLSYTKDRWEYDENVAGLNLSMIQLEEYPANTFWATNNRFNLFRFQYDLEGDSVKNLIPVGHQLGLPEDKDNFIFKYKNELLVGTLKGVYHYVPEKGSFKPYPPLVDVLGETSVRWLATDAEKDIFWYMNSDYEVVKIVNEDGKKKKIVTPYKKIKNKGIDSFTPLLQPLNEGILVGVDDGAVFYRESDSVVTNDFKVSLRKITVGKDSLMFAGGGALDADILRQIDYSNNRVRFDFSALFFEEREQTKYSYRLEGNEDTWSDWSTETSKEYNNLWEGTYTFKVKAKNLYEAESEITTYSFKIFPPFYRAWWAYVVYVLLLAFIITGIVKLNSRRLAKENEKLEGVILQRTQQIQLKQEEILAQNEELIQNQEELQTQRDYIEQRNNELEFKNQQIELSIQSAETIQQALLPSENLLSTYFQDYFLLYKPRDIVSGDFYWVHQQGDDLWVVVADCTGHGVPGAFMTLLGKSILDKLIKVDKLKNTAEVVTQLDIDIRTMLNQDETINQRGMDLVLIKIAKEENKSKIQFTGAKNNLYVWPTNSLELHECKANRISIGTSTLKPKEFSNHTLTLEKGSVLFLCTDGFQDQNNENRIRYKRNNLKKLLFEHIESPLAQQKDFLEDALNRYTKNTSQRDDILIMGVKV